MEKDADHGADVDAAVALATYTCPPCHRVRALTRWRMLGWLIGRTMCWYRRAMGNLVGMSLPALRARAAREPHQTTRTFLHLDHDLVLHYLCTCLPIASNLSLLAVCHSLNALRLKSMPRSMRGAWTDASSGDVDDIAGVAVGAPFHGKELAEWQLRTLTAVATPSDSVDAGAGGLRLTLDTVIYNDRPAARDGHRLRSIKIAFDDVLQDIHGACRSTGTTSDAVCKMIEHAINNLGLMVARRVTTKPIRNRAVVEMPPKACVRVRRLLETAGHSDKCIHVSCTILPGSETNSVLSSGRMGGYPWSNDRNCYVAHHGECIMTIKPQGKFVLVVVKKNGRALPENQRVSSCDARPHNRDGIQVSRHKFLAALPLPRAPARKRKRRGAMHCG